MRSVGSPAMRRLVALSLAAAVLAGCGDDGPGEGDAALFCERLDRLTTNDPFAAFGDTASARDIETAFAALLARADELVDVAPPDVRAAAGDYADAARALDAMLDEAGYLPSVVDPGAYRNEQTAYTEAAARLERYLESEC